MFVLIDEDLKADGCGKLFALSQLGAILAKQIAAANIFSDNFGSYRCR